MKKTIIVITIIISLLVVIHGCGKAASEAGPGDEVLEKVKTPIVNPSGGNYTSGQSETVSITCETDGAVIYYTTNGSEPTRSSSIFTSEITVTSTKTIKAKAFKTGMNPSNVGSATFTFTATGTVAAPVISPPGTTFTTASQSVSITCATAGATIYYTTNGSTPTTSSTVYGSSFSVSATTTVKAIAVKTGLSNSTVTSAVFTKDEVTGPQYDAKNMVKVSGSFYSSMGMYKYVPSGIYKSQSRPLIVVLHGCSQTASSFANETGWNKLADKYKFFVVYADHSGVDSNYMKCYDWWSSTTQNGGGQTGGIKKMIDKMRTDYNVSNTYVYGLSAGAGMAVILAAKYPSIIKGSSINAGLPYKGKTSSAWAAATYMGQNNTASASTLAAKMPNNPGTYGKMIIFHGSSDSIVNFNYQNELMKQWTQANGTDQTPEVSTTLKGFSYKVYKKGSQVVVATVVVSGMGHAITVDPGSGNEQGGATAQYSKDKDLYSAYWSARFWGIIDGGMPGN